MTGTPGSKAKNGATNNGPASDSDTSETIAARQLEALYCTVRCDQYVITTDFAAPIRTQIPSLLIHTGSYQYRHGRDALDAATNNPPPS